MLSTALYTNQITSEFNGFRKKKGEGGYKCLPQILIFVQIQWENLYFYEYFFKAVIIYADNTARMFNLFNKLVIRTYMYCLGHKKFKK